jgi:predicted ATP-dependent endonuclease of OLD family
MIFGVLGKPLIVERSAEDNQQWLMDVLFDALVDVRYSSPTDDGILDTKYSLPSNMEEKMWLRIGRENIELLLSLVLEDENVEMILNYRNQECGRVSICLGNGVTIPSFKHLSAGQAILFNLFATIIRYADRTNAEKSINLAEIKGIVLIDEIDAHLHTDLQYQVLPKLVKLFPKVQFIITSHAPLFLLGMEREFGADGIQILEMPTGKQISTERFEEFLKSFEFYRQTEAFENAVGEKVLATSKPLVLTEGQTDVVYINTALKLLGYTDLLEQLEIDEVGQPGVKGSKGSGYKNLDNAYNFLENNPKYSSRRVLLLYDCDTTTEKKNVDLLSTFRIPKNPHNTKVTKGFENLLPVELFEERFYQDKKHKTEYGGENIISHFCKQEFCEWVCKERGKREDFFQFEALVVPVLKEFLSAQTCKLDDETT